MRILSLNFLIFSIGGVWRPVECTSGVARLLYNAYTVCAIASLYFLVLTQFLDIVLLVDNVDDFVISSQMFVTIVAVCCKATVAVTRRDAIIDTVRTLLREPCKPRDENEVAIQMKFDKFIRYITLISSIIGQDINIIYLDEIKIISCSIKYSLLATSSVTGVTIRSVLNVMGGYLPYRVWLPYDSNTSLTFWFTSVQQIMSVILATLINVGTETLVFGFLLQTCAQLEIFENRLHKSVINRTVGYSVGMEYLSSSASSKKQEATLSEYIRHHLSIYKYAKTVNKIFNQVLFVQFFGSILVLCTNVYYLSAHLKESEAATYIVYTICMFVQIYVYCWSGNEVILKSTSTGNTIYHMDWPLLSVGEKRDLLMIMKRSKLPIKFTSSFLIILSLESFSNILKMSYTAFNVLQR